MGCRARDGRLRNLDGGFVTTPIIDPALLNQAEIELTHTRRRLARALGQIDVLLTLARKASARGDELATARALCAACDREHDITGDCAATGAALEALRVAHVGGPERDLCDAPDCPVCALLA